MYTRFCEDYYGLGRMGRGVGKIHYTYCGLVLYWYMKPWMYTFFHPLPLPLSLSFLLFLLPSLSLSFSFCISDPNSSLHRQSTVGLDFWLHSKTSLIRTRSPWGSHGLLSGHYILGWRKSWLVRCPNFRSSIVDNGVLLTAKCRVHWSVLNKAPLQPCLSEIKSVNHNSLGCEHLHITKA